MNKIIKTYDKIAKEYGKKYGQVSSYLVDYGKKFLKYLKGKKVLDLGCGPGRDSRYLSNQGLKVYSIDASQEMVREAKKRAPRAIVSQMDMRKLDFPEDYFNGVWANFSLLHLEKKELLKVLQDIYQVSKPEGLLFIGLKKGTKEQWEKEELDEKLKMFYSYYTKEELTQRVKDAGFEMISVKEIRHLYESDKKIIVLFARKQK